VTGRTTRQQQSEYARPETIEETAELVSASGGDGFAVQVDHLVPDQVARLVERIRAEQGRLDVLVNDIWAARILRNGTSPSGRTIWRTVCACSVSACIPI
jgi:NAD(P)-dependent dehydrogenase (short-subunit alcohol dehydrogenase family)